MLRLFCICEEIRRRRKVFVLFTLLRVFHVHALLSLIDAQANTISIER